MWPLDPVRTVVELREITAGWRLNGCSIGLIPTMGALHEGHLSLVRLAKARADRVVTSLFVNPTQFGPNEDFSAYPRDEARDRALLTDAGCDLLYAPGLQEIYPPGFNTSVNVGGPSQDLEGEARPGHFAGVATVVAKLLNQTGPDIAVFGEKDFQQLLVIRRLTRDLDIPVEIIGAPIVRDADGLALSSRNAYLNAEERLIAPALSRALGEARSALLEGAEVRAVEAAGSASLLAAGFTHVDYFTARHPETLRPQGAGPLTGPARLLGAALIGRTRLLDNLAV